MPDKTAYIEEMPAELLADPLAYIFVSHYRQRTALGLMRRLIAGAPEWEEIAPELVGHIRRDMRLHVLDEEENLFPILRRRCQPEDEIERVLEQLSAEHGEHKMLAGRIAASLKRHLGCGRHPGSNRRLCALMTAFADREHRHLALENCVVLPIARVRLTAGDLRKISEGMRARRQKD